MGQFKGFFHTCINWVSTCPLCISTPLPLDAPPLTKAYLTFQMRFYVYHLVYDRSRPSNLKHSSDFARSDSTIKTYYLLMIMEAGSLRVSIKYFQPGNFILPDLSNNFASQHKQFERLYPRLITFSSLTCQPFAGTQLNVVNRFCRWLKQNAFLLIQVQCMAMYGQNHFKKKLFDEGRFWAAAMTWQAICWYY